jgi:hypothetical protein
MNNHDDDEYDRKVQLKTRAEEAETSGWRVFKRFFRPRRREAAQLGIPGTPETIGLGGCIILMDIVDLNQGTVEYRYTDQLVVSAFAQGIIARDEPPYAGRGPRKEETASKARAVLSRLDRDIEEEHRDDAEYDHKRITIPADVFVTAKGPDHLLGLLWLRNIADDSFRWPNILLKETGLRWKDDGKIDLDNTPREVIARVAPAAHALLGFMADPDIRTPLPTIPSA